jgi:hypothetical protein
MNHLRALGAVLVVMVAGCTAVGTRDAERRAAMNAAIRAEAPGDYHVGRRMYKKDYKVWGWIREPGKPWKTAQLVMLNEQRVLAPDRAAGKIGSDHNYEYRLSGFFSGDKVYEPASNRFYPEFVLTGHEIRDSSPPDIYQQRRQNDPAVRLLQQPL